MKIALQKSVGLSAMVKTTSTTTRSWALQENKINVTGPLERYRDLTYVDDMVEALLVGLRDDVVNETINACTSTKTTIEELIDTVIEAVHSTHAVPKDKFTIENVGGHAGDSFGSTGCNDKLIALGWEPKVSLAEGIDKLWRSI